MTGLVVILLCYIAKPWITCIIGLLIDKEFLMSFRKFKRISDNGAGTNTGNSRISIDSSASMGFTRWVNKDISKAEETGDWSELLMKAEKQTRYFKNTFYSKGR